MKLLDKVNLLAVEDYSAENDELEYVEVANTPENRELLISALEESGLVSGDVSAIIDEYTGSHYIDVAGILFVETPNSFSKDLVWSTTRGFVKEG